MQRFGRRLILAALVFAVGAGSWSRLWAPSSLDNHHLHQARAFLQGRLSIDERFTDVAVYGGENYVVFPPLPALLLTPLVAVFGLQTRTTIVALVLTGVGVWALRRVLVRMDTERVLARWLLLGFFLGTAYTPTLFRAYETWPFAHLVAVTCLLLALAEALGRARGLWIGLACAAAILSRQLCVCTAPLLIVLVWQRWQHAQSARRWWQCGAVVLPLAAAAAAYLVLNAVRFGNPLDSGYSYLPLEGVLAERVAARGLFDWAYVPFNLVYLFLQGPHVEFGPPRLLSVMGLDPWGTPVTFASPFVFLALLARGPRAQRWTAWLAVGVPLAVAVLYYNNGYVQTHAQRFLLDGLPVLMLLVAAGAARVPPVVWKFAIAYSIALNAVVLLLIPLLERLTAAL